MREAFRLNKSILTDALSGKDKQLCIAFIFMGVKEETFQAIEYNMKQLLSDIQPPLTFWILIHKKTGIYYSGFYLLLSRQDSNLDWQNQNLQCYHYTTGQKRGANIQ